MRLLFDHGTLVLAEAPDLSSDSIPGLMWDPRVGLWRAPAFRYADVIEALRRRRLPVRDEVPAPLRPNPEPFRPIELRPYQPEDEPVWQLAAPAWDLIREPKPVEAGGALTFPDFELVHRHEPKRRWLLEIVGFWTAEYLKEKLARLRAAGLGHLILCIDSRRQCHDAELPEDARVIRYKSRIDPRAVVAIVGQ